MVFLPDLHRLLRRWRLPYCSLLAAMALLSITSFTLLLLSDTGPTLLEETVRTLRSLPNDFARESSHRHAVMTPADEQTIIDTLAVVDGLRPEFDKQQRQEQRTHVSYGKWLLNSLSSARNALPLPGNRKYPSCGLSKAEKKRYAPLRRGGRIYIAINLLQNEELMPTLTRELLSLLRELGPDRAFVSIYENASMDLTVMHLRLLCTALEAIGTPYHVIARGLMELQEKDNGHRIIRLARVRNAVLEPLIAAQNSTSFTDPESFETVLYLNDVFHCHGDVLELLLEKQRNQAVQACGIDFGPSGILYDRWVLRNMRGEPFYRQKEIVGFFEGDITNKPRPQMLPEKEDLWDRTSLEAGEPFQVFSCWNGVTAFTASAFAAPTNLRFRTAHNDPDSKDGVTDKTSECYLSSVDLWKAKIGRIMMVPRTRVAYSLDVYEADRASAAFKAPAGSSPLINWSPTPPAEVIMHDFARWYYPETKEPWDAS